LRTIQGDAHELEAVESCVHSLPKKLIDQHTPKLGEVRKTKVEEPRFNLAKNHKHGFFSTVSEACRLRSEDKTASNEKQNIIS
jgi:hypothetical protein